MRNVRTITALALAGALTLAACGKGEDESTAAVPPERGAAGGGLATDFGVTDTQISLGVLTDQSGPFKDLARDIVRGHQLWQDQVNSAGGICDRQINLIVRDHGYKADTAKIQFPEVAPDVVGFLHLLGSPPIAALDSDVEDDQVTTIAISWSSELLDNPYVVIAGATYDIEMINGLSYLLEEGKIEEGDTLGHIYIEGEYGNNGLRGAKYFAQQHDMKLKTEQVTSTDSDLKNIVAGFEGDKVSAILLTTTPSQTASAAAANKALGLDVPMLGNNPTFAPQLNDTPAAEALTNLYVAQSAVPFASDIPKAADLAETYTDQFDTDPSFGYPLGFALGGLYGKFLTTACENGDMTRVGIAAAREQTTTVGTESLLPDLDFSNPGSPSSREVYVATPDADTPGGLRQVKKLFASEDAMSYVTPHEQDAEQG